MGKFLANKIRSINQKIRSIDTVIPIPDIPKNKCLISIELR